MMGSLVEWLRAQPDKRSGQLQRGVRSGSHLDPVMAHAPGHTVPALDLVSVGLANGGG